MSARPDHSSFHSGPSTSTAAPSPRKRKRSENQVENRLPAVTAFENDEDYDDDEVETPAPKRVKGDILRVGGATANSRASKTKSKNGRSPKKNKGKGRQKPQEQPQKQSQEQPQEPATPSASTEKKLVIRRARASSQDRKVSDAKNTQRRVARRQAAQDDPQAAVDQRLQSGLARSPVVGASWLEWLLGVATRERAIRQAVSAHLTDSDNFALVAAVVKAFTDHEGQEAIPDDVLLGFPSNVDRHVASGALAISKPTDLAPRSCVANYLRRILVGKTAVEMLTRHLASSPADAANTIVQLVMLGEPLDRIESSFQASMVDYGLDEAVCSLFLALQETALLPSLANNYQPKATTILPYAGLTYHVAPGKRGWDDLDGEADVRVVNFLQVNGDVVDFETYHVVGLDTPITNPLEVRTNPLISHKERVLRAVLGAMALNSDHGGVRPNLLPSPFLTTLKEKAFELCPAPPFPLGQERAPRVERLVRKLLEDEADVMRRRGDPEIDENAFENLQRYAADVVRVRQGRVVKLELAKDVPREVFQGTSGGYWVDTVGLGPQEHRHMLRVLHPTIPNTGNLSIDVLAQHVGPILDFWRLILLHLLYWLHVLWLSRMLGVIRPIVLVSQSNPIAAMVQAGDLTGAWQHLSDGDRQALQAGTTPDGLDIRLPERRYRHLRGEDFTKLIGKPVIIRTGPNPAHLSIHLPHADYGRLKYDPILKRKRWNVDFFVEVVSEIFVRMAATALDREGAIDWEDALAVRQFLEGIMAAAQVVIEESGVGAALAAAKNAARREELSVSFLRALRTSKLRHEQWVESGQEGNAQGARTTITAAPAGEQREAQLEAILEQAWMLDSFDLLPDPDHLAPYEHAILSDTWPGWFRKLKDGADVVNAANAKGRNEAGVVRARANQARIGPWSHANAVQVVVDPVAFARQQMRRAISQTAPVAKYTVNEFDKSARMGRCTICQTFVVGHHNQSYHKCTDGTRHLLNKEEFPDLERILYAHDILGNPSMEAAFEDPADVAAEFCLVPMSVREILQSPRTFEILGAILRPDDLAALSAVFPTVDKELRVFLPEDRLDDYDLRVTLAIDVVLSVYSNCEDRFLPQASANRLAWTTKQAEMLKAWFEQRNKPLVIVVCDGPSEYEGLPHFMIVDNATRGVRDDTWLVKRSCPLCNHKRPKGRRFFQVTTLLDLPPHHARFLWLDKRREVVWPPQRASKTPKGRRTKDDNEDEDDDA
ncbi:hypothetical protein C8R45DRAFT_919214 [Mycena sanguinolenta]|nr:hypothetical protein C8R45DRAFT_919214 [Mycena sanguinolenta]